jgi:hypothetical protein
VAVNLDKCGPARSGFSADVEAWGVDAGLVCGTARRGAIAPEAGALESSSRALNEGASLLLEFAPTASDPPIDTAELPTLREVACSALPDAGDRKAGVAIIGKGSSGRVRAVLIKKRART